MTLEDIKKYYGSSYQFMKITGYTHTNFNAWKKKGYVPYLMQGKLQALTEGALVADYTHGEGRINVKPN
jgi:hypothetical protein